MYDNKTTDKFITAERQILPNSWKLLKSPKFFKLTKVSENFFGKLPILITHWKKKSQIGQISSINWEERNVIQKLIFKEAGISSIRSKWMILFAGESHKNFENSQQKKQRYCFDYCEIIKLIKLQTKSNYFFYFPPVGSYVISIFRNNNTTLTP